MREELFPFSIGSAPQSLDLSHAFPPLFAPPLLGAIFARSASRIDSQASTAGNSPRAYNFNCTSSPASGNDLLWFFLLLQLFLTTKKDNKPPPTPSPQPRSQMLCVCAGAQEAHGRHGRGEGVCQAQPRTLFPSTLPAARQEHNSHHSAAETGQRTSKEMSSRLGE